MLGVPKNRKPTRLYSLSYFAMLGSQRSAFHAAKGLGAVRMFTSALLPEGVHDPQEHLARYFWNASCASAGARAGHQSGGSFLRL